MKRYIKASGVNMKTLAENLEVSPQNLNSKLNAKSLKADFEYNLTAFPSI